MPPTIGPDWLHVICQAVGYIPSPGAMIELIPVGGDGSTFVINVIPITLQPAPRVTTIDGYQCPECGKTVPDECCGSCRQQFGVASAHAHA